MLCDECDKPAEFTGIWPWGADIKVCSLHRLTTNQKATQQLDIPNGITFAAIDPNKPVELGRDERTQLRAQILTRDDELADLQRRVVTQTRASTELADEVRRLRGVNSGLESQLKDAKANLETALAERSKALADAGKAITERDRLELVLRNASTSPSNPTARSQSSAPATGQAPPKP